MPSLLFIISFLLHIIALYTIYRLYQQLRSFKKEDTTEIMELFETYLHEIKEENKRLQEELNRVPTSASHLQEISPTQINKDTYNRQSELSNDMTLPDTDINDVVEASLEARILQLHHQGMSISEIAKKLNRGKTEVELFIKLYQKK